MAARPDVPEAIYEDLYDRLNKVISNGDVIPTLGPAGKPNTIHAVTRGAIHVITERSRARTGAEEVPGWAFNVGWKWLNERGELTYEELVKVTKRSSAVLAILARLPEVQVVSFRPIRLALQPGVGK